MIPTRLLFLCLFVLFTSSVLSQQAIWQVPGIVLDSPDSPFGDIRSVIWQENFSNGIPGTWGNAETGGVAKWEYRGPLTNPAINQGGRGSCITEGTESSAPVDSETSANGFVIFDSNYWDNPDLPCNAGNFGTGPAPGPHFALLTTPSINLSAYTWCALEFTQYLYNYDAETRVEMSVGQGNWSTLFTNTLSPGSFSARDQRVFIPLGSAASNAPDVRIRFVFDGLYYYWQLDDVRIIEIPANDLSISSPAYAIPDVFNPDGETGFEEMEYNQYPDEMPPLLRFSASAMNIGGATQNNSRLGVVVKRGATVLHNGASDPGVTIASGASQLLESVAFQMPESIGAYEIQYALAQNETDDNPDNNTGLRTFDITDQDYARDTGPVTSLYIAPPEYGNLPFHAGNIFTVAAENQSAAAIRIAPGLGTSTPTSCYGAIYVFDRWDPGALSLLAQTSSVSVTADMINNFGEEKLITLPFDHPVPLQTGVAYLVVAGSPDGADYINFAMSGVSPDYTSWIHFSNGQYFTLTRMPMVRMVMGPEVSVNELEASIQTRIYPNPADEEIMLNPGERSDSFITVRISDPAGKICREETFDLTITKQQPVYTGDLKAGVYIVSVHSPQRSECMRLIVEH